jgi:hypothetical protein
LLCAQIQENFGFKSQRRAYSAVFGYLATLSLETGKIRKKEEKVRKGCNYALFADDAKLHPPPQLQSKLLVRAAKSDI